MISNLYQKHASMFFILDLFVQRASKIIKIIQRGFVYILNIIFK